MQPEKLQGPAKVSLICLRIFKSSAGVIGLKVKVEETEHELEKRKGEEERGDENERKSIR